MGNAINSFWNIVKKICYILTEKQKKNSIIVFFSMIVLSGLELISVTVVYSFIQCVISVEESKEKWYLKWMYVISPDIAWQKTILILGLLIIIIFLLKNAFAMLCSYIQYKFSSDFSRDCSTRMLESYIRHPYEFFLNTNSAIVLRGVNSDANAVYQTLISLFQLSSELLTVMILGVSMIMMDPFIAVCAIVLAGLCLIIIVLGFKGKIKDAGIKNNAAYANRDKNTSQIVLGIKELSVLERKNTFVDRYYNAADELAKTNLIHGFLSGCPDRILEGVCVGGLIGIISLRIVVGVDINAFVPVLGYFAMSAFKILPSVSKISSRINSIVFYQKGVNNCYENIKESEEDYTYSLDTDTSNITFEKEITINNIKWHYLNDEHNVINDLSLKIKKGDFVAFIGESGSGKTTLADIFMGLLPPQSGEILIDGENILSNLKAWHKIIGYVPQTPYLIDDTIKANVALGIPEKDISDEKVWKALEKAQLKDFIKNLPQKIDTMVGERGIRFSGGQRQRIALARALYDEPEILVLDEATSALDNDTEKAVMESIDLLKGHKTLIVIAHRLTTIRNCNRIYEIKDGMAIEKKYNEIIN